LIIYLSVLLRMRNVSDKTCRESQNTYFMFSNFFFQKSCPLWDNVGKYGRAGEATGNNVLRLMSFAYWKTKARIQSHTHIIWYVLLFQSNNICKRVTLYIHYLSWIPCGEAELKAALLTSCESIPDQRADNMGMLYANMCSWSLENVAAILYSLT